MAGKTRPTPPTEENSTGIRGLHAQQVDTPAAGVSARQPIWHTLDDVELVEAAKSEPEAFGVLYERHVQTIFAFAYSKTLDRTVAEDLTSQTFLQALRALPRYQQRGVPIRSWLFRITANLIADRHRSPITEQPLREGRGWQGDAGEEQDRPIDLKDPRAEAEITAWEQAQDFARLIEDLSPEQRTVVRLRFAEGLSMAEIAGRMSRSEGAVKMLLLRALQNLRRRMTMETADAG